MNTESRKKRNRENSGAPLATDSALPADERPGKVQQQQQPDSNQDANKLRQLPLVCHTQTKQYDNQPHTRWLSNMLGGSGSGFMMSAGGRTGAVRSSTHNTSNASFKSRKLATLATITTDRNQIDGTCARYSRNNCCRCSNNDSSHVIVTAGSKSKKSHRQSLSHKESSICHQDNRYKLFPANFAISSSVLLCVAMLASLGHCKPTPALMGLNRIDLNRPINQEQNVSKQTTDTSSVVSRDPPTIETSSNHNNHHHINQKTLEQLISAAHLLANNEEKLKQDESIPAAENDDDGEAILLVLAGGTSSQQSTLGRLIKRSGISDQRLAEIQMIRALKKQLERATKLAGSQGDGGSGSVKAAS